jgi:hypothetical protein
MKIEECKILENRLLGNIKNNLEGVDHCLGNFRNMWGYEDIMYRYFCGSFKVFGANNLTSEGFDLLKSLDPKDEKSLDEGYTCLVERALPIRFNLEMNKDWMASTAPIVNAFLQTQYFLEMTSRYGHSMQSEDLHGFLPSGWAALLILYKFR